MTSKAQKNRGWLLPETIETDERICIQFEIPDKPEYRLATRGAVQQLAEWFNWEKSYSVSGDTRATDAAQLFRQSINETYSEGCIVDCEQTIDCLESDENYIGLNSVILSQALTSTQQHAQALDDDYDGSAQSVGANIPVGAPDATEQNALCYALQSYISLYAATKLSLLQQANVIQISWSIIRAAQVANFNSFVDWLAPIYDVDIFACWPDDITAMIALQDDTALESVACCLFTELDGLAMTASNFNDAIDQCAMSLTGTAGDIACVLSNDNDLDVYLMFLESYNIALQRQIDGETLPVCPCETGWCNLFDYTVSQQSFTFTYPSRPYGIWTSGQGFQVQSSNIGGDVDNRLYIRRVFSQSFTIDEISHKYIATAGGSNRNRGLIGLLGGSTVFSHNFGQYNTDGIEYVAPYTGTHTIDEIRFFCVTDTGSTPDADAFTLKDIEINGSVGVAPTASDCP